MPVEAVPQLETFSTLSTLCLGAAERIASAARTAVHSRKRFRIALSGGEALGVLYRLLGDDYRERIPWAQVSVYFADEMCGADGNYAALERELLSRVPIPKRNLHQVAAARDAEGESRAYEEMLRHEAPSDDDEPAFDMVLLNVGADGAVASLYPGSDVLNETERWVTPVCPPASGKIPDRITLTVPILCRARELILVAAGGAACALARGVVSGSRATAELPAARLGGMEGTFWLVTPGVQS